MSGTLKRTLMFFTTQLRDLKGQLVSDQSSAFRDLKSLPFRAPGDGSSPGRAVTVGPHLYEAVDVWRMNQLNSVEGRIYRTKTADLPAIGLEDTDQLLALPDKAGLRFSTHFVWWDLTQKPEFFGIPAIREGLLVAEYNTDAPRPTALQNYVREVFAGQYRLEIQPLAYVDPYELLGSRKNLVKSLVVRMPFQHIEGEGLGGLYAPSATTGAEKVKMEIKAGWGKSLDLTADISRLREATASGAKVAVQLDAGQTLDLLHATIKIRTAEIDLRDGTRSVVPASILKEIRNVVDEHRAELGKALGRHLDHQDLEKARLAGG